MSDHDMTDTQLVAFIRRICARELEEAETFDFFSLDYEEGESADDALVRLYTQEKMAQIAVGHYTGDEDVVLTLCHG